MKKELLLAGAIAATTLGVIKAAESGTAFGEGTDTPTPTPTIGEPWTSTPYSTEEPSPIRTSTPTPVIGDAWFSTPYPTETTEPSPAIFPKTGGLPSERDKGKKQAAPL